MNDLLTCLDRGGLAAEFAAMELYRRSGRPLPRDAKKLSLDHREWVLFLRRLGIRATAKLRAFHAVPLAMCALLASGCAYSVGQYGDAQVSSSWPQFFNDSHTQTYSLSFPDVDISHTGTHVFEVRNLPSDLRGKFKYDFGMDVTEEDITNNDKPPPWRDAKITIVFRRLNGIVAYKRTWLLGDHPLLVDAARAKTASWLVVDDEGYNSPVTDDSFDIEFHVEQPSGRATDRIHFWAWCEVVK
jgi:hypothetical protein